MSEMIIVGQEEHYAMCNNFVQFETFGVMEFSEVMIQLDEGNLVSEEVPIPIFAEPFSGISLTPKGQKFSQSLRKIWDEIYMKSFKNAPQLLDYYEEPQEPHIQFAMSRQRLLAEWGAGRMKKVIELCPKIEPMA